MDQTFQLLLWCDEDNLYAELRCERPLPCRYHIVEEGHHFQKRAANITVCRRFTRRHWTYRPGSCCIGSLCWITIPKSCMTPR